MSNGIDGPITPRRRLSLVMPAYNEEAGIQTTLAEALEALAGLDYQFEILVVDDGSSDRTGELVEQTANLSPAVRLLRHSRNRGYGAALRTGFKAARYELVAFTDADGQFFLEDLEQLVERTDRYSVAVGFRIDRQDSWRRRFYSWGYNKLVRCLLGTRVRDCDCALKVFRREVLPYLLPQSKGFLVNAEMMCSARQLGLAIAEVGVRHRPRRHGSSKVSLFDIPRTLVKLLPLWWSRVVRGRQRKSMLSVPLPPLARSVPLPAHSAVKSASPTDMRKSA